MDLSTITVADFKALFARDFPYLPVWSNTKLYNAAALVYYDINELFYISKANGNTGNVPTDATKWDLEAPQSDIDNYVQDSDITKAFAEAKILFNQTLWSSDDNIKIGYLYLTAAYLVNDLRAAMGGISANAFMPLSSRSVGNVSEAYAIPDAFKNNPSYAFLMQSAYGLKYLSLVLPQLVGNVTAAAGDTLP